MITIQREYGRAVIDELKPFFTEDGGFTREVCANELKSIYDYPDSDKYLCMIVAREGFEIKGFLVANQVYGRCFLNQAYSVLDQHNALVGFNKLREWAKESGCTEIRAETEKNSVVSRMLSKYGFNIHTIVLRQAI